MIKRSLALGCAVAALAAGTANAQTKFDVTVGGDAFFQGAYIGQDQDQGLRTTEFRNRFRLVITPTAKADNGLEYGGRIRLRAAGGNPNGNSRLSDVDRGYVFASGVFGTVQLGVINGLSDEYGIIGPNVEGIAGGPDNGTLEFLAGSTTYASGLPAAAQNFRNLVSGDVGTKAIYLTPKFAGFQAGISYMPRTGDNFTSSNRVKRVLATGQRSAEYQDVVEFGGLYSNEFGDLTVEASAYYQLGTASETTGTTRYKNLSSYNIGANIGYAGFKIGAMYMNAGKSGYDKAPAVSKEDQDVWVVGANYTTGPFIFAANYLRYKDAGDLTVVGSSKLDLYQAGVTYTVAPGLTAGLEYSYFKSRADDRATYPNDKGSIIMLDTRLAF